MLEVARPTTRRKWTGRALLLRVFTKDRAIRFGETIVGAVVLVVVLEELLGFSLLDANFWTAFLPALRTGFLGTLGYSAAIIPAAFAIGFLAGWARVSRFRILSWPVGAFVDLFRGLPPIVLAIFAFLFGPELLPGRGGGLAVGLNFAAFAIALHSAAYQTEIFRAGFQSVPRGQLEASQAVGLTPWQTMRIILLPQTFRLSLPALANEFATVIKDTSLLGALGAIELFSSGQEFSAQAPLFGTIAWAFAVWVVISAVYFLLTSVVTRGLLSVENRYRVPGMEVSGL